MIYADALRVKGLSLYRQGLTLQATNYLESALDIYICVNDTHNHPSLLWMETGLVYLAMGNTQRPRDSYEEALKLAADRKSLLASHSA